MVIESQERVEFWFILGGKKSFTTEKVGQRGPQQTIVRLFEVSNLPIAGRINLSEVYQFVQDDLSPSEIMLLDAWDSLFVWIGASKNSLSFTQ